MNWQSHLNCRPEYPAYALPQEIREAIYEIQQKTKAPLAMVASSVWGAISLACQHHVDVLSPNGSPMPCSLFQFTLGESNERKSTIEKIAMSEFRKFEESQQAISEKEIVRFQLDRERWYSVQERLMNEARTKHQSGLDCEAELDSLESHKRTAPIAPTSTRITYSNTTLEALFYGMHSNSPSVGLISAEAGGILDGKAAKQLHELCTAWDGNLLQIDRRSSESFTIPRPRLTIMAMMQPNAFDKFLERKGSYARRIGFLARFLIASPESTQGTRFENGATPRTVFTDSFHSRIAELLANYTEKRGPVITLKLSKDAQAYLRDISNNIECQLGVGGFYEDIKDCASKLCENICRMAALIHVFCKQEGEISYASVKSAHDVVLWHANEFKRIITPDPEIILKERALLIEKWIFRNCRPPLLLHLNCEYFFEKNAIYQRRPNPFRTLQKEDFEAALQFLMYEGKIMQVNFPGTKKSFIKINSQFFFQNSHDQNGAGNRSSFAGAKLKSAPTGLFVHENRWQ